MSDACPELEPFLSRYMPHVASVAHEAVARLRQRLPTATCLVYDNYNAFAVGFSPDDRASNAIISIAVYPRWVNLFFLQGASFPDPDGLLKGKGRVVRHMVLDDASALDRPEVASLIEMALERAKVQMPNEGGGELIVKSISARQRPRRPAGATG